MVKRVDRPREWKCLTVRQPHAWAIITGAKDVENRPRRSNYVGRLHIHAGLTENTDQVEKCVSRVAEHLGVSSSQALEAYRQHLSRGLGAIIGSVHMFGCAVWHESPWFDEDSPYAYLLRDPRPLKRPIPYKGSRGFWTYAP